MKAVVYHGRGKISVDEVGEPQVIDPTDAVIRVTAASICGSDLHIYGGYLPGVEDGDVLGHEFVGEAVELGGAVTHVQIGDRVAVPFVIACGECFFCKQNLWALCERSNPDHDVAAEIYGHSPAGLFGHGHVFGGYRGGLAEYVRVPYAHIGLIAIPNQVTNEQALLLTDVAPTGFQAAEACRIQPTDTVAVWGAGAVGQFAAASASMLGARQVIIIDRLPERLGMATQHNPEITTINFAKDGDVLQQLLELTDGRGPDACIDAVGLESHAGGLSGLYDRTKRATRLQRDRLGTLQQIITACRKGGVISVPAAYSGFVSNFPLGAAYSKNSRLVFGQTNAHRYVRSLMRRIMMGNFHPELVVTHRLPLDMAVQAFTMFRKKKDQCIKIVFEP